MKDTDILSLVFALAVVTAIWFAVVKVVDDKIDEYASTVVEAPKIKVVNMAGIIEKLTSEGEKPIDVLVYTQTLLALLAKEGYLVVDQVNVLVSHPDYQLGFIPKDKLLEAARKKGIDIMKNEQSKINDALESSQKRIEETLSQFN